MSLKTKSSEVIENCLFFLFNISESKDSLSFFGESLRENSDDAYLLAFFFISGEWLFDLESCKLSLIN